MYINNVEWCIFNAHIMKNVLAINPVSFLRIPYESTIPFCVLMTLCIFVSSVSEFRESSFGMTISEDAIQVLYETYR